MFTFLAIQSVMAFMLPIIAVSMGPPFIYYSCGGITLIGTVFVYFFVLETSHLTDKQKKLLYSPKKE